MIFGPTRSEGPAIMTEGFSKGRQKAISTNSNHVITIITTSLFLPHPESLEGSNKQGMLIREVSCGTVVLIMRDGGGGGGSQS